MLHDGIAVLVEAESDEALDAVFGGGRGRTVGSALFRLEDLGAISTERWFYPKDAMFSYYSDRS